MVKLFKNKYILISQRGFTVSKTGSKVELKGCFYTEIIRLKKNKSTKVKLDNDQRNKKKSKCLVSLEISPSPAQIQMQ